MISATRIFKTLGQGATLMAALLFSTSSRADINIVGNVYGGGNEGDLTGHTEVVLRGGTIEGDVYGGARKADVGSYAFVNIDGQHAGDDILVRTVYGGNDISGSIGNVGDGTMPFVPSAKTAKADAPEWTTTAAIDKTWNAFVLSTSAGTAEGAPSVFVGSLFGGGNGDYDYASTEYSGLSAPTIAKTYLQIEGGTFAYVYGGGNEATVTGSTDIYINNPDAPTTAVSVADAKRMGVQSTAYTVDGTSGTDMAVFPQTIDRVFGGNNLAPMDIQPNWYLIAGRANNVYSGGNKGAMTCKDGILVYVFQNEGGTTADPVTGEITVNEHGNKMQINNIYGGCRMADVQPASDDFSAVSKGFSRFGYNFPAGYAARVYISGGNINNVYGGNDVSGDVYAGTDVEINGAISGDVYGGGNGSYAYTDNPYLAIGDPDEWADYYYDADGGIDTSNPAESAEASLTALNLKRPHVENTLVHIFGEGEWRDPDQTYSWRYHAYDGYDFTNLTADGKPTMKEKWETYTNKQGDGEMTDHNRVYVTGGVYCGGNSASLQSKSGTPTATLQIGQCVTMDEVFLGSNGAHMIEEDLLHQYAEGKAGIADLELTNNSTAERRADYIAGYTEKEGSAPADGTYQFVQFDLREKDDFDAYMSGVDVNILPNITYDNPDNNNDVSTVENADRDEAGLNFSTHVGNFFCGGNVGSMTASGTFDLALPREMVIYNKVVGGCNAANVAKGTYNAFHMGGLTNAEGLTAAKDKNGNQIDANDPGLKLKLYVPCRMQPMKLVYTRDPNTGFVTLDEVPEQWNTDYVLSDHGIESDVIAPVTILVGGNIYGGCYTSGYVNGSVQIDIKDELCSTPQMREWFGDVPFVEEGITDDNNKNGNNGTAIVVDNMRRYVLNHGWSAFGGGYGLETEIWGNTYMNMERNAGYINAYGGGDQGFIGKMRRDDDGNYVKTTKSIDVQQYAADGTATTVPQTMPEVYEVTTPYNTYVNLRHDIHRSLLSIFGLNAIYGGGYKGVVTGNTNLYAGGGLHYDVFGGACNADVYGSTQLIVGQDLEGQFSNNLTLRHCAYGGNDFGGQVYGTRTHDVTLPTTDTDGETGASATRTITSNTYVQYLGGTIESGLYGGSCGLYRYDGTYPGVEVSEGNYQDGDFYHIGDRIYPVGSYLTMPTLKQYYAAANTYNTFVDINNGAAASNYIVGNIYGGGYGFCDEIGRVDASKSLVVLRGQSYGNGFIANQAFGGGYFSNVDHSTLEAVSGRFRNIYGGTYGTTVDEYVAQTIKAQAVDAATLVKNAEELAVMEGELTPEQQALIEGHFADLLEVDLTKLTEANYTSKTTHVNVYSTMDDYTDMDVYGAGAFTGAGNTWVNLFGGEVRDIYGGSNREGVSGVTHVSVPLNSTISVNTIYGGSHGSYEALPCDVEISNIDFLGSDAVVRSGNVFGGNNAYRATRITNVNYNAKARANDNGYLTIFGAGNGDKSVAAATNVTLGADAIARKVYGGGYAGDVFNQYDVTTGTVTDASGNHTINATGYQLFSGVDNAHKHYCHWDLTKPEDDAHHEIWTDVDPDESITNIMPHHTWIKINEGAKVMYSVYGAGYGPTSVVAGHTLVENYGTIVNDIFGGGEQGNIRRMHFGDSGYLADLHEGIGSAETVSATINLLGGDVRNVFGGGYEGYVGDRFAYNSDGTEQATYKAPDAEGNVLLNTFTADLTATTNINMGKDIVYGGAANTHYNGHPSVALSLYGAGDRGAVYGDSYVNIFDGHVGYDYNAADGTYTEHLKYNAADNQNIMKEDGNVYGGGFGETAHVRSTHVNFYDGTIRNSLYGGGEMAAVGWGDVKLNTTTNELNLWYIDHLGSTEVNMYGGQVNADVFGGGRGYSYDNYGVMQVASSKYFTDGFVFGTTSVDIHGGTVGTDETIKEENGGHGNVFGGGNIGYVYGGNIKDTDGYYYHADASDNFITRSYTGSHKILSEDVRVDVRAYGRAEADVTIPYTVKYSAGQRVAKDVYDRFTNDALKAKVDEFLVAKEDIAFASDGVFHAGDYIPNEALNTLPNNDPRWTSIDDEGIVIRNAVFAGGNVSKGSDRVYAFAHTIFGNATASLVDVYARDLIEVGEEGLGGLYGDGNLTYVDGYRELNVSNYGTDFFALQGQLDLSNSSHLALYNGLTSRQKAFYTTKYLCTAVDGDFPAGSVLMNEDYERLKAEGIINADNWKQSEAMINEGRYLNTLQRADYAGIKGSRLVLKGAMDRAQGTSGEVDFTDYTINRVGELSLNRNYLLDASGNQITETIKITDASGNLVDATLKEHGSYFGIYNVVKYLGGIMSDYDWFAGLSGQPSVREAQTAFQDAVSKDYRRLYGGDGLTPHTGDDLAYGKPGASFFNWKVDNMDKPERNNGTVANKIALASGVFLELVKEPADEATATEKEYGPVIGIVELDLLNVAVGEGGGYVYAKNIHGQPSFVTADAYAAILSDGNQGLKVSAGYHYGENDLAPDGLEEVVTSGNFVHPSLTVVDDCFPMEKNLGEKAHYWYIKGSIYVYDQLISTYTGNAGTYSSTLDIPLTMNNKYNTSLQLVNILPGLYTDPTGLYNDDGTAKTYDVVFSGNATQSFKPNQPISFWQWHNIPSTDAKNHFVLETYRCNRKVKVGTEVYQAGQALTPDDYTALETACTGGTIIYALDDEGNIVTSIDEHGNETPETLEFDKVFHVTNGLNHANDFLLTYDLSNPNIWNDYYSKKTTEGIDKMTTNEWTKAGSPADYLKSATFTATASGVYGQKDYSVDDIISNSAYAEQTTTITSNVGSVQQANFEPTYIVKKACKVTYKDASDNTVTEELNVGFGVSESFKNGILTIDGVSGADKSTVFEPAYVCLSTFQLENKEYRFRDQIIGATEYATYDSDEAIQNHFQPAWSCVTAGKWGGQYFENGQLYKGVDVAAVSKEERDNFIYNYDALDLLIADYIQSNNNPASTILTNDPASEQNNSLAPYDGPAGSPALYSKKVALDVTATYEPAITASTFTFVEGGESTTIADGSTLTGEQFSLLPNDRRHYAHFAVSAEDASKIKYIPVNSFSVGSDIITAGVPIDKSVYDGVPAEYQTANIAVVNATGWLEGDYYICLEEYVVGENNGHVSETAYQSSAIQDQAGTNSYAVGATVPQKAVITKQMMIDHMPNLQNEFTISGVPPVAEATLYVPIDADIEDYMEDRYVTAIYDYQYQEKLNEFDYVTNHEKHVVNILVKFLSPKVNIGRLREPDLKLPTEVLAIQTPAVDVGAFEVLTAGWELYGNEANAESHRNGRAFKASTDSLFWYMDGNYLAYYAETNMGRTYSDPVRVSVANYHRLDDVLANVNRLGIDYKDAKRAPRIYITDDMRDFDMKTVAADGTTINSTPVASPLDAMAKLYDLTMGDFGDKEKNHGLDIRACQNLEFFLQSDINMKGETWTPLGANAVGTDETNCAAFSGNLHGNGHTILGLDESLFDHFCGYVVNLGVTGGSYYGPLIAKGGSGHVENCWVTSNAERPADADRTYPFIGQDEWVCPEHHTSDSHAGDLQGHLVNCYYLDDEAAAKTTSEADANQDGYYLPYSSFTTGADHHTTGGFRTAFPRSKADFINGNVAYALNRFYLEARQAQYDGFMKVGGAGAGEVMCNVLYRYPAGANGSDNGGAIAGTKTTGEGTSSALIIPGEEKADDVKPTVYKLIYPQIEAWFGGEDRSHGTLGYVEALYHDGDFRFADGLKPVEDDIRMVNANEWLPIYPDDYIFFGQKLTYGLYDDVEHDIYPTAAAKHHTTVTGANVVSDRNGLLIASDDYANSNRLFRTPAYYGNGTFGQSVVFNYDAAFAAEAGIEVTNSHKVDEGGTQIGSDVTTVRIVKADTEADSDPTPDGENNVSTSTVTPMDVQKGLTAIDFTGYQPSTDATQWSYGFCSKGHFYHPLSDFAGLSVEKMHDYRTDGLTQNLLVYVPDASGNYNLMKTKILDLDYTETNTDYRTVKVVQTTESSNVNGHLVKGTPNGLMKYTYSADRDQFLVDKQDFNCPISYTFEATDQPIMWYQRTPSKFANADTGIDGWSTIVLPFTATVVTTNTKGEITHFYGSSTVGHEYWLRKYEGAGTESVGGEKVTSAVFNRPAEDDTEDAVTNVLTNDFLWDWYYSKEASQDKNTDIYHQEYYHAETEHGVVNSYENYPFLTAGVPYIIAFPGKRYYEFDMSGTWTPSNTFGSVAISSPGKQTVTYASSPEVTIAISDAELKNGAAKASGFTYAGAYAGIAAADAPTHYAINAEGTAFDQKENGATTAEAYEPFRAYFTGSYSASNAPRRLVIGNHEPDPENEPMADVLTRGLTIYGQKGAIVIESTLNYDATVIITTTGGQMLQRIVVPAETRQVVPVDHRGIFIANHQKVAVM